MHLVRLLLPVDQHGTTEACAAAAFALAQRFGTLLEILYACPPAWQRLPYSSELSPYAVQELIEVERKQAAVAKRRAKTWCEKQAKAHAKVKVEFAAAEGLVTSLVAHHARMADLSVVPSIGEEEAPFWTDVRDGALFQFGPADAGGSTGGAAPARRHGGRGVEGYARGGEGGRPRPRLFSVKPSAFASWRLPKMAKARKPRLRPWRTI